MWYPSYFHADLGSLPAWNFVHVQCCFRFTSVQESVSSQFLQQDPHGYNNIGFELKQMVGRWHVPSELIPWFVLDSHCISPKPTLGGTPLSLVVMRPRHCALEFPTLQLDCLSAAVLCGRPIRGCKTFCSRSSSIARIHWCAAALEGGMAHSPCV